MATGQRVVKHRHVADEALAINAGEFAVIGVMLLRLDVYTAPLRHAHHGTATA